MGLKKTKMKTLEELKQLIIEWAKERDLIHKENAPKQRLKLIEECGELAKAILKDDIEEQKDAIGDIFVVLIILAEQVEKPINPKYFNYNIQDMYLEVSQSRSGRSWFNSLAAANK